MNFFVFPGGKTIILSKIPNFCKASKLLLIKSLKILFHTFYYIKQLFQVLDFFVYFYEFNKYLNNKLKNYIYFAFIILIASRD